MMENADIIIVGGGIIGCVLFYELSKKSDKRIILLDQNQIASGTTGQSGGFIRKINPDPYLSQLSRYSFDYYQSFFNEVGRHCDFIKTGLTYKVTNEIFKTIENNLAVLNSTSYPIHVEKISSNLLLIHEHNAGFINPKLTCQHWVSAAKENKAICYEHVAVEKILIKKTRVYGVLTSLGTITSDCIIIATGASSIQLLAPLEIPLPISIKSFQYNLYEGVAQFLESAHMDLINEIYLFPLKNGDVIAGFLNEDKIMNHTHFDQSLDKPLANSLHYLLSGIFPWIQNTSYIIKKSYDAFTPDHHGLIQQSTIEGLVFATGLSSGGIKIAPALAQMCHSIINDYTRKI